MRTIADVYRAYVELLDGAPAPRTLVELTLAAHASGYRATVTADLLNELDPVWLIGEPETWPFADDERASRYCDLAEAAGLIAEA